MIKAKIHFYEIDSMLNNRLPYIIQFRILLNSKGFKFKDDGKPSLISNEEPEPLGELRSFCNIDDGSIIVTQVDAS